MTFIFLIQLPAGATVKVKEFVKNVNDFDELVHGVFKGEDPTAKPGTIVSLNRTLVIEFDSYMSDIPSKGFRARYYNFPLVKCPCRLVKSKLECYHRSIDSFPKDLVDKCDGYFVTMKVMREDFTELTIDHQNIQINGNVIQTTTSARSDFWLI